MRSPLQPMPNSSPVIDLILGLRAIKSPSEIAVIREAYRIAEAGTAAALAATAPGVTEREIAAEAEHAMRRMGSEGMGIDTIVGSGKENTFSIICRTTNRRIGKGDHVLITLAPRYEGYHAAIGRVAAVGQVDERIERAVEVAIEAQETTAAALRPGVTGAEIDAISRGVCRAAGLERYFAYSGIHSVGLVEFEAPILTSKSTEPLSADMVFSIDIPVFFAPWGGLRIEEGSSSPRPARSRFSRSPREFAAWVGTWQDNVLRVKARCLKCGELGASLRLPVHNPARRAVRRRPRLFPPLLWSASSKSSNATAKSTTSTLSTIASPSAPALAYWTSGSADGSLRRRSGRIRTRSTGSRSGRPHSHSPLSRN